jgi:hypothetical protein
MARQLMEPGSYDAVVQAAGFKKEGTEALRERQSEARAAEMDTEGEYRILGAFVRGSGGKQVRVKVEQNTSPMAAAPPPFEGVPVVHQPVAIVEGPVGSVCVNLDDPDAEATLARAYEAVTDPNYQKDAV